MSKKDAQWYQTEQLILCSTARVVTCTRKFRLQSYCAHAPHVGGLTNLGQGSSNIKV